MPYLPTNPLTARQEPEPGPGAKGAVVKSFAGVALERIPFKWNCPRFCLWPLKRRAGLSHVSTYVKNALVLAFMLFGGAAGAQDNLRIAAVVNDDIISAYDLMSRLSLVVVASEVKDSSEVRRHLAPQVLRSLIEDKLKLQEAKRLQIRVSQKDINQALDRMEKQNGMPKGGLDIFLRQNAITKPTLIEQLKAEIAWAKTVVRKFGRGIRVGDDDIDEKLDEIRESRGKPEYLVAEIFLSYDNVGGEDEVRSQAERMIQQIREGASFPFLARSFSHSSSAAAGGDLGWIRLGKLGGELDTALAKMQPGTISPPIQTQTGYYILALRKSRVHSGAGDVTISLRQLYLPLSQNAGANEVASQMSLATTMSEVAYTCADMETLALETGSQLSGDLGQVKLSKLPDTLRGVVENLPIGKASKPQRMEDGVVVFMVCGREGDKPAAKERAQIKRILENERLTNAARRYLRDLHRSAFVDVRI